MCSGNCNCNCNQITLPSIQGEPGDNGLNSFTTTTASFVMPNIGSNVTITVSNTSPLTGSWAVTGQSIYVENAGYFVVVSSTDTTITITNNGIQGNVAPSTVVASGQDVSPAGISTLGSGQLVFDYFNATAGTGSFQLFNGSSQDINYTDYALSTNGDEIDVTAFIFTGGSLSSNTSFKFRFDGTALLTTPTSISYSAITRVTFEIKLIRVTSTTLVFMAKQYKGETNGQTTVYDWSSIGTISVADLDSPGNYPLSVDFQVNSDVAATLGWQSIQSIK